MLNTLDDHMFGAFVRFYGSVDFLFVFADLRITRCVLPKY